MSYSPGLVWCINLKYRNSIVLIRYGGGDEVLGILTVNYC